MNRQFRVMIEADELERKILAAADAIRRNAERRKAVKLHIERWRKARDKTIALPASLDETEEGEDLEEDF